MSFADFFKAAWNRDPFPWQERLAERVLTEGWPDSIGLPTAAGKTALIDIAIYSLAMGAPGAARRIFFVVDRRIIVDEAAERAVEIADKLEGAGTSTELGRIAAKLRSIGGDDPSARPVSTAVLRGGIPRDSFWNVSPLQPIVICSTVDQVGSSLLFRGYGASEYARPIRAAVAAYDSLLIIDEAHTSQPFLQTLRRVAQYRGWAEEPIDGAFSIVEMSATPRGGEVFRESAEDLKNPVLKARWGASKRARLVVREKTQEEKNDKDEKFDHSAMAESLAREALRIRRDHGAAVIGVIANRVLTARLVFDQLQAADQGEVILMTGRARPWDRDELWRMWKPAIGLGGVDRGLKPVFVVATQCIEVGANIDFDGLVSEVASIDALEQRFGRLNRQGRDRISPAAIVGLKEQTAARYEDPIYGAALSATWAWLKAHLSREDQVVSLPAEGKKKARTKKVRDEFVEMGVLAFRTALASTENREALVSPKVDAPVLMPAHVDLLCQTSPEPAVMPEPAVFLHGPQSEPADVLVIWRAGLRSETQKSWINTVAVCPPSSAEAVSLPVWVVRKWLRSQPDSDFGDMEGVAEPRPGRDRSAGRVAIWWRGPEESVCIGPEQVRPGIILVVPSTYGGCDRWGWNPECADVVRDVGDAVKVAMGKPMLRLNEDLAAHWGYSVPAKELRTAEDYARIKKLLAEWPREGAPRWLLETVAALSTGRLKLVPSDSEDLAAIAVRGKVSRDGEEVPLDKHLEGCKKWAGKFARELPDLLRATVIHAAAVHDIGKADPRFQAWLRGGNAVSRGELIAKSKSSPLYAAGIEKARLLAGFPKGGRHELMSVALLAGSPVSEGDVDYELLLHLVGSHHGRCRPFAPVVEEPDPVSVDYLGWGASSNHGLDSAGSGISERFWKLTRRYGWYGLAYLESIVRLSDYRQSDKEQEKVQSPTEAANA